MAGELAMKQDLSGTQGMVVEVTVGIGDGQVEERGHGVDELGTAFSGQCGECGVALGEFRRWLGQRVNADTGGQKSRNLGRRQRQKRGI